MGERYSIKTALESPETLATVVHAIFRRQYGEDAYDWDPTTLFLEARDDFRADVDTAVMDRWSAIQVVMTTDSFFKRLDAFMGICNTLSTGAPFFQLFDPVTVEEAAWGITEVSLNREILPFSYPVKEYLKTMLKKDGYDEGEYPGVFVEVFNEDPKQHDITKNIRTGLATLDNEEGVEAYIDEQLNSLVHQFNEIPSLKDLDDIILHRSMSEYIGTAAEKVK